MNLAGTYKFLSQTGDYATYLSKKVYAGEAVSAKEHEICSGCCNTPPNIKTV